MKAKSEVEKMSYFKKHKHIASDNNQIYWVFTPTIQKQGPNVVFIKGQTEGFSVRCAQ